MSKPSWRSAPRSLMTRPSATKGTFSSTATWASRAQPQQWTLIAQAHPSQDEDRILARLKEIRPQAWPNLRMMEFADDLLGRGGRLVSALGRLYGQQLSERPRLAEVMRGLNRNREVEMAEEAQASKGLITKPAPV